ncbi:thioredoxin family protein [uncultured Polaribacter sp.]|uniref:thioredoxin family protein n=1 Tax=uncultured Polaribacter sp. TaxID=174711 RepID=UPI002621D280|nr:thioredoxin family protein [uncultured Polaribacter sp.]
MNPNLVPSGVIKDSFDRRERNTMKMFAAFACPQPKYAEMRQFPHGLKGYFDLAKAKVCANVQNKPIFIEFTGHGCMNYKEMETRIWSNPQVLEILKNEYVMVYIDEKTKLQKEDCYISEYGSKTKKTMGKQNANYQMTKFTNSVQPYYVLINLNGKILAPTKAYDLEVENFIDFLKSGIKEFYKN